MSLRAGSPRPGNRSSSGWVTPAKLWLTVFGCWIILLSGVIGSPGILQLFRLHSLLTAKHAQAEQMKESLRKLEERSAQLETSKLVQQREIRRVLGYAASDELIFDFTADKSSPADE